MASKPENLCRTAINKLVPPHIHREKMGNPFSAGTADQWYSAMPYDLWIEYKFLPRPPKRSFKLQLSELQRLWLRNRYNEGRAVGVILCFPGKQGCWMFFNTEWEGYITPDTQHTYTRQEVAAFITRSCTIDAYHSAIVRSREDCESRVPYRDILSRDLLHTKGNPQ